jgi:putative ABC transport system permease protein
MRRSQVLWMALRSLTAHGAGSGLLLGTVVVTTAITLALSALCFGWKDERWRRMSSEGRNGIRFWADIHPQGNRIGRRLRLSDMAYVKQACPLLEDVCALDFIGEATTTYQGRTLVWNVHAFTANFVPIRDLHLAVGRSFTEEEDRRQAKVVVLGSEAKRILFPNESPLGKRVTMTSQVGRQLLLTVIGVFEPIGWEDKSKYLDKTVYIPMSVAQHRLEYHRQDNDEIESLRAMTAKLEDTPAAMSQMRVALEKRNVYMAAGSRNFYDWYQDLTKEARTYTMVLMSICCAALFASGVGLMKMMLLAVAARSHEIGLRKALGATSNEIQRQFLVESGLLGAVGALLGLALGALAIYFLRDFDPRPAMRAYMPFALLVYVVAIATIFGILPARRAAALDPAVVLRQG